MTTSFDPLFRSPHLQTVIAHYWPRKEHPAPVERRLYKTEPDVQVLVESQRPAGRPRGHIVLVHGLEGSSQAGYMVSLAAAAVEAGFAAHRFNHRTCGGTAHLCPTLYHAGLTSDLRSVLQQLREQAEDGAPFFLAGFSLGGNVVLKLVSELGESARGWLARVASASTPIDLARCVARMRDFDNWIYEKRFLYHMRRGLRSTGRYSLRDLRGLWTLYGIDDKITAPSFGFEGADHYYRTQSAQGYLAGIAVPTLLLQAQDDTYVPFDLFEHPAIRSNPCLHLVAPEHGGHLGFLTRSRGPRRFWMDTAILEWFQEHFGSTAAS